MSERTVTTPLQISGCEDSLFRKTSSPVVRTWIASSYGPVALALHTVAVSARAVRTTVKTAMSYLNDMTIVSFLRS